MNSAGLESSKEQRQEIDTKEKAALPAGDGNGIYLQTKAPFPVHSLLSTPETQMWMKKGIMLERQLGKGGWGEGAGGGKRGGGKGGRRGKGNKTQTGFTSKKCSLGKRRGKVSLPRALSPRVCVSFSKSQFLSLSLSAASVLVNNELILMGWRHASTPASLPLCGRGGARLLTRQESATRGPVGERPDRKSVV